MTWSRAVRLTDYKDPPPQFIEFVCGYFAFSFMILQHYLSPCAKLVRKPLVWSKWLGIKEEKAIWGNSQFLHLMEELRDEAVCPVSKGSGMTHLL